MRRHDKSSAPRQWFGATAKLERLILPSCSVLVMECLCFAYRGLYEHLTASLITSSRSLTVPSWTMSERFAVVEACKYLNYHGHGFVRRISSKLLLESLDLPCCAASNQARVETTSDLWIAS